MEERTRLSLFKIGMAMRRANGKPPPVGMILSADGTSFSVVASGEKVELKDGAHYETLMTAVHLVYKNRTDGNPYSNVHDFWFRNRDDAIASLRRWYDEIHSRLQRLGKKIVREHFGERQSSPYLIGCLVETNEGLWIGAADFRPLYEGLKELFVDEDPPRK